MFNAIKLGFIIGTLLSITVAAAVASDTTKVDLKGERSVSITIFNKIDPKRVTYLDSDVNDVSARFIINDLRRFALKPSEPAYLVINSPGGSVVDGMDIVKHIKALKFVTGLKTICIVDGMAASMAAIIASYCHQTLVTEDSIMMFHKAWYGVSGDTDQVKVRQAFIDKYLKLVERLLARQLGITFAQYAKLRSIEYWLVGDEIVRYGFADGIVDCWIVPPTEELSTEPPPTIFREMRTLAKDR